MLLSHLPDFQRPLRDGDLEVYAPFEPGRPGAVPPERLEVATLADGSPDFSLELVRGASPALPPAPYGVLDLRVRTRHRLDEGLALARAGNPGARLEPASLDGGFLRLRPLGDVHGVPEELLQPVPLAWNGLGVGRLVLRLSAEGAALIERSLRGEILPLVATAEVEWTGVSPRLPVRVRFDPARLLAALRAEADANGLLSRSALLAFFRRNLVILSLETAGEVEPEALAAALADRVRVRFGRFVPAPGVPEDGWIALASPEETGTGTFLWDLEEPLAAPRPRLLALEPLRAAREVVAARGVDAVVRRSVVPAIPTGVFEVSVTANLPAGREVLALGATLRVPPRPPARPQAVEATVDFAPPGDAATVRLRLSPAEPLEYTWSTFAVVEDEAGIERLESPETPHAGPRLHLGPEDFPVDLVAVSAAANLLDLADVRGLCRRPAGVGVAERAFELRPGRPAVALALPRRTPDAELEIEALPRDGGAPLRLGPFPAAPLDLGLHSFPEYGPHTVEVRGAFRDGDGALVAVDLLPEDRPESETTVLFLTPERPSKPWTYLARSPFRAGYRFRPHPDGEAAPAPWSAPRSPFEPLELAQKTGAAPMTPPTEIALGGLRASPHPDDPSFFVYDPGDPEPERSPQGHPVFQLLRLGDSAFLQMGVRWGPGAEALEALREEIARRTGRPPAQVRLTPLPVAVESVRLELADGDGGFQEIARSTSSGAPPYSALFNVRLDAAQTARAAEAAAGKEGALRVTYHLSLSRNPRAAERASDVAHWFRSNP